MKIRRSKLVGKPNLVNILSLLKYLKLENSGGEGRWLYDQPLLLLIRFTRYARSRREWLSAETAHKTLSSRASKVSCSDVHITLDVQCVPTAYPEMHFHLGTTTYMTDRRLWHANIPFIKSKTIPGAEPAQGPADKRSNRVDQDSINETRCYIFQENKQKVLSAIYPPASTSRVRRKTMISKRVDGEHWSKERRISGDRSFEL